MSRLSLWLIIALSAALLVGGCGPVNGRTVRVEEESAGQTVELDKGDRLEIVLPGNITTGYSWEVASVDAAILRQVGEVQFEAESGALGAGGVMTLSFETAGSGQTNLKLIYHRSFEKGVEPLQIFELNVVVK